MTGELFLGGVKIFGDTGTFLKEWELLIVCHNPAKFGGHKHCGSRSIMFLVCHVISQDHVIKGLCDFMDKSPSW